MLRKNSWKMDKQHLWRIFFISLILCLSGILGKPTFSFENSGLIRHPAHTRIRPSGKIFSMKAFEEPDLRIYNKRGFSMLARWKPFNLMGRQRTAIRDASRALLPMTEYDIVSAETRAFARPAGQPLRWG